MSAYLDGELAATGRARLERHVGECPDCERLLAGLRRMLDGLRRLSVPDDGRDALQVAAAVRLRLQEPPAT
jgi:anti-sigma factor RsiW